MDKTVFTRVLRTALAIAGLPPEVVCKGCVTGGDVVCGRAGDFALCGRCLASVTSKTGVEVKKRRALQCG